MNRRNFIHLFGCSCLSFGLSACGSAPITDRKQLKLIPESNLNAKAAQLYEKVKEKETLSDDTKTCLLYTSPSPRDGLLSRMPSSA